MDLFFSSFSPVPAATAPVWAVLGSINCFGRECNWCCLGLSITRVCLHLLGRGVTRLGADTRYLCCPWVPVDCGIRWLFIHSGFHLLSFWWGGSSCHAAGAFSRVDSFICRNLKGWEFCSAKECPQVLCSE